MSIQATPRDHAEVSEPAFFATMWIFTGVTLAFVLARLGIRLRIGGKLAWDDALVVLAWLMLLATAIVWKIYMPLEYRHYATVRGEYLFDTVAIRNFDKLMKVIAPMNILFYSGLWAIKFSFMLFFAKLGNQIRSFKIWWWIVLAITAIAYIGCIADIQWECTTTLTGVSVNCATYPRIAWVNRTLQANCGLDVGSDLLILSLPVAVLWNTRVPLRKKIVLLTIFAATVAIMIVSIIRVTLVNSNDRPTEIVWLYFWSFVENGVAIIIACVASFRQLFVNTHGESSSKSSGPSKQQVHLPSFVRYMPQLKRKEGSSKDSLNKPSWLISSITSKDDGSERTQSERTPSEDQTHPLEFVTVHPTNGNDLEKGRAF
ncbi:hypothetical protein K458DRAFT_296574 [Lentithecium fluviatile CBS 122367]|uniref:Rhodopsin domain-containing protein n=1 Tax=Lentithecium fluviatile CBS 122367 TaxID=1168545 RepID=A0A6G1JA93_9PLEO|nr:hypothetical protein K458DRAFT_296574 [Lentithecium fluviatile CBS 122367]